nr:TlpA disulfide reductase family protein [Oleiagrimonas sp. C23AA]
MGPLALPAVVWACLVGLVTAQVTAHTLARRGKQDAEQALWWSVLAACALGRAVFVTRWWRHYGTDPLGMLDIRDRGFDAITMVATLLMAVLWFAWRRSALRWPLVWSTGTGGLVAGFVFLTAGLLEHATHQPLPHLSLPTLKGRRADIASDSGQPVVLNLWATWCGPCRREMPVLARAADRHKTIRFVFANQGESAAVVGHFLRHRGLGRAHQFLDTGQRLTRRFNVHGYPTTLFFDASGTLRSVHLGELSPGTLAEELAHITPSSPNPHGKTP